MPLMKQTPSASQARLKGYPPGNPGLELVRVMVMVHSLVDGDDSSL